MRTTTWIPLAAALILGALAACQSSYVAGPATARQPDRPGWRDWPYAGVRYEYEGTNPQRETKLEPRSTFAVDVDDASYAVARHYLDDGNRPDPDSVRVEEFVNHFDYGYPTPREGTLALIADGMPSPFAEGKHVLRFALKAKALDSAQRAPARLTLVVDVSGSMQGEARIGLVVKSLEILVDNLRPDDALGIVTYGPDAREHLPMTPVRTPGRIRRAIRELPRLVGGNTNLESGMKLALGIARDAQARSAGSRIVILSDGVANTGETSPERLLRWFRGNDVPVTAVGVGMGTYDDTLLESLGDQGEGLYAFVDSEASARRVFGQGLAGTLTTVAKDAKVQVEFDERSVRAHRLLGYENRALAGAEFRRDAADGGEMGAGHSVTALYEVEFVDALDAAAPLATFRVRYMDPVTGQVEEVRREVTAADLSTRVATADPGIRLAAAAAHFAEVLRKSPWAPPAQLLAVERLVGALPRRDADTIELERMVRSLRRMEGA